jgi:hypothetical protein
MSDMKFTKIPAALVVVILAMTMRAVGGAQEVSMIIDGP